MTQKEPPLASPVINDVASETDLKTNKGTHPGRYNPHFYHHTFGRQPGSYQWQQGLYPEWKDDFMVLLARDSDSRRKSRLQVCGGPS